MPNSHSAKLAKWREQKNIDELGLDILISPKEMRNYLGVNRTTIYRWTQAGYLAMPIKSKGKLIGWRESELLDWLSQQSQKRSTKH